MSFLTPISGILMHLDGSDFCLWYHSTGPIIVVLLDGTHIYGILRSIDQFGMLFSDFVLYSLFLENLVLENSFERYFCDKLYTENYLGTQIVQGHSVMLVGTLVYLCFFYY